MDRHSRKHVETLLARYRAFIRTKANQYADVPHEVEDFEQVGREAVWRASTKDDGTKPHEYYRTAIKNAMLNHSQRVQHRPNGAYVQDGTVHTLDYRRQASADEHWGGLLWGDYLGEN